MVPSPEVVNNASFILIFPFTFTFIANTFVPGERLPDVLKTIAGWNPVSTITHAAREHFGNLFALTPPGASRAEQVDTIEYTWALRHAELYTLGWVVLLLVIFVPLSTAAYKKAVAR